MSIIQHSKFPNQSFAGLARVSYGVGELMFSCGRYLDALQHHLRALDRRQERLETMMLAKENLENQSVKVETSTRSPKGSGRGDEGGAEGGGEGIVGVAGGGGVNVGAGEGGEGDEAVLLEPSPQEKNKETALFDLVEVCTRYQQTFLTLLHTPLYHSLHAFYVRA